MSAPTSLDLPVGVQVVTLRTPRGDFAAHVAAPQDTLRGDVLLIPGFTGSKEDFTPILPLLASAGWQVTAYDQRGQYQTVGSPVDDYSLDGFAADAIAVREVAAGPGTRSHLLGHSFGGLVAQAALLAAPQSWSSLTLMCTGPAGFDAPPQTKPLAAFIDALDSIGAEKVFEIQQGKKAPVAPEILTFLRDRFTANSPQSLKAIAAHLTDADDRIDEITALDLPKFVVRGRDDDEWSPQVQARMAERLGLEAIVIGDSAHSPAVENPTATAQILAGLFAAT